jgi:hypothetical protein
MRSPGRRIRRSHSLAVRQLVHPVRRGDECRARGGRRPGRRLEDPAEKWTVHFRDDDTFVEDYQGVEDFRVGKYSIADGTVKLEGDDGNTDEGTVEGETLVFKLGTLKRAASSSGQ